MQTAFAPLAEGEYAFVVERRPTQLAVWPLGRPGSVGLVELDANTTGSGNRVRVRPLWHYGSDATVHFDGKHRVLSEKIVKLLHIH